MTWKDIIKEEGITPEDEKLDELKDEITYLIGNIRELAEKTDDLKYLLRVKTLDDMLPEDDIRQAVKHLNGLFMKLYLT